MIAIVRYNAGNTASVRYAVERLGFSCSITDDADEISRSDKVIFPGVGAAGSAMEFLKSRNLDSVLQSLKQPVLGICLGLQLLCAFSDEGNTPCLGIFDARVNRFPQTGVVPHTGWNQITVENQSSLLLRSVTKNDYFYFVHSYYAEKKAYTTASTHYLVPFSAVLEKDNFFATQFHPEKSARAGERILNNFLTL